MKINEEIVEEVVFGNLYRLMINTFSIEKVCDEKEIYFIENVVYEKNNYEINFYRIKNKRFLDIKGIVSCEYELTESEVLAVYKKRRKRMVDILFLKLLSQRGQENWPGEKFY